MPEEKREKLLQVEHLCQYFGKTKAVDDVSFDVYKGEVFGLVGESGCGKTTTGRSIIKLYNITSGNIYFEGIRIGAGTLSYKKAIKEAREKRATASPEEQKELDRLIAQYTQEISRAQFDQKNADREYGKKVFIDTKAEYEAKIAAAATPEEAAKLRSRMKDALRVASRTGIATKIQMIFQDPIASLDPRMTVREIIAEGLKIKGIKDQEYIDSKVYEMLEMVGLVREHAGRYPHEFSGGQRQRIGIARAIIMEPEMLIADEPISALDVSIQAQVINLLNELRERLGLTVLFIAHDLSVVKYFSDRIGVMYYGNMVELAETEELFAHPLHPYTRSLLSAIPLPDPRTEKLRKRIIYNPLAEHDYEKQKPSMREILPGHFVRCNDAEEQKYREELNL